MKGERDSKVAFISSQKPQRPRPFTAKQRESPTRRFNRPTTASRISGALMGAGDDPMAKSENYS